MGIAERTSALETRSAVQDERIDNVEMLISDHIRECRETRRELRVWLMGILGSVITAAVVFYLKFG